MLNTKHQILNTLVKDRFSDFLRGRHYSIFDIRFFKVSSSIRLAAIQARGGTEPLNGYKFSLSCFEWQG